MRFGMGFIDATSGIDFRLWHNIDAQTDSIPDQFNSYKLCWRNIAHSPTLENIQHFVG